MLKIFGQGFSVILSPVIETDALVSRVELHEWSGGTGDVGTSGYF